MLIKTICLCTAALFTMLLLEQGPAFSQASGGGYGVSTNRDTAGADKGAAGDKMEKHNQGITADQQPQDKNDLEMTKKIRQAIMEDKSLSMYADNVEIITRGGMVTLKGPVKTQDEKNKIIEKAAGIAGKDKVTDNMEVKEQKK